MNWISIKDRLPENEKKNYLCAIKRLSNYAYIQICSFSKNLESVDEYDLNGCNHVGWYNYNSEWGFYEVTDVTHWMELPDLPEEN